MRFDPGTTSQPGADNKHHFLDLPGVVGCQSREDDHSDTGYDPGDRTAPDEDVDDRSDHNPNETHEKEAAPRGQVPLGQVAIDAHGPEHAGRDNEGRGTGVGCIDQSDNGKNDAVDRRIGNEQERCRGRTQPVDSAGKREYQDQLSDHQAVENQPVARDCIENHR